MKRQTRQSCFESLESRRLLVVPGGPVNDAYDMSEDTALIVGKQKGLIANDVGVTAVALGLSPTHGTLFLNKNGSFGYQPKPNFVGLDTFTYRAVHGEDYATVSITVKPDTSDVDAVDDNYETLAGAVLHVSAADGLLANDSGIKKVASLIEKPQHGRASLYADGSFMYRPDAGFFGIDTFAYRGVGRPGSDAAIVTINVVRTNEAPVAEDDFYQLNEDNTLVVEAPGVLWNDSDPNDDNLTVAIVDPPQHGSLTLNTNGSFEYTPDANWWGSDGFNYTVSDGEFLDYGNVALSVQPVNDPPVAIADYLTMNEDNFLILDVVLQNDIDIDASDYGDTLTMNVVGDPPQHGTLRVMDGQWIYEPDANYFGTDSFTYEAWDSQSASGVAIVTIQILPVNDRPAVTDESFGVLEDTPLVMEAPGVLFNDSDIEGDALSAVLAKAPEHGQLLFNLDGSFTYIPDRNYFGTDSFQYRAKDYESESLLATVSLDIAPVDDSPWVNDDAYTTDEDEVLVVEAPGVLANDVDVDQETLITTLIIGTEHGELIFNIDGSFAYTPDPDWYGVDSFQYIALDEDVETLIGYVTITVNPVNDDPFLRSDVYEMQKDGILTATEVDGVLANDYDVDGDVLTVTLSEAPDFGILFLATDGAFAYTPNNGYVGNDFFTYHVEDGNGGFADAIAMITVSDPGEGEGLFSRFAFIPEGKTDMAGGQAFSGLSRQEMTALDSWFTQLGKKKAQASGSGVLSDLDESDIDRLLSWFNI